jgi:hypothetical protein
MHIVASICTFLADVKRAKDSDEMEAVRARGVRGERWLAGA